MPALTFPGASRLRIFSQLKRALQLVWQSGPHWALGSTILAVVQGLLPVVGVYLTKLLFDAIAPSASSPAAPADFRPIAVLVALIVAVALGQALLGAISALVNDEQSQAVSDHVQALVHQKALQSDLEYYENSEYYNTLHRAQQEAPYRPPRIVQSLVQLGQNAVLLAGIAALLFTLHWAIVVVLVLAILPAAWVRYRYTGELFVWRKKLAADEREAGYYNLLLTTPYSAKEIKLFGLGALFQERHAVIRRAIRAGKFQINQRRCFRELWTQIFVLLPVYGAMAFIAYRAAQRQIGLGDLVMFLQAFQRGQAALQSIMGSILSLHEDNLFLTTLYDFMALKPKVLEPSAPCSFPRPMQSGIALRNVSFSYANSEHQALNDISLTVAPGEVVALVGENGSGKTTLVKLLCRLYDPSSGCITVDGIDMRSFHTADLRRQMGVVFQDYIQYQATAYENIWFGNIELPPNDERIIQAAKLSGADEVLSHFEAGYQTHLGKFLRDGEELSIGQWQKIAIARAFVRDAQLVILDEPTSALDARAEAEVFDHFRQLIQGRSAILISHRLSTVKMADKICVLEKGRLVEIGTHDELVQEGGLYAHLFETQAQAYV